MRSGIGPASALRVTAVSPAASGSSVRVQLEASWVGPKDFAGHVGVLFQTGTTRLVADVTNGRGESALRTTRSIGSFEGADYDGARRLTSQKNFGLSLTQQASLKGRIAHYIASKVMYDDNHLDQKGTWVRHNYWWQALSHWEFDCVGFVERIYEDIGLNPTPNSYESGWGWPLTPREQRDSGTAAPYYVNRTVKSCATGAALGATQRIDLLTGYTNYTCGSRYQDQCVTDGTFDNYYDETCHD